MRKPNGFTLIELSAVIVILLLLISISIPLLNNGSSQHEIKLVSQSVQSLLSLCSALAKSAGKVYMADMDTDLLTTSTQILTNLKYPNHPEIQDSTLSFYRFSVMRIYSCEYNETTSKLEYSFEKDSYNIPVSSGGYLYLSKDQTIPQTDHIYFKPDGSIACDATKILFCSPNNTYQYYVLDINRTTGTFVSRSYKD